MSVTTRAACLDQGLPVTEFTPPTGCTSALARVERMAARLLGVPLAQLWLRADVALGAAEGCPDAERQQLTAMMTRLAGSAICRHVVAAVAPLVIGDPPARDSLAGGGGAALAAELADRGWRACLAVPLLGPDEAVIGVLMAADRQPRSWTVDDVAALDDLATIAADGYSVAGGNGVRWLNEIALREAQVARRKNEERLSLIFNSTSDLTFLLAVEGERRYRCVAVNESYLAITGMSERAVIGRRLEEFLTPEAADRTIDRYDAAIALGEPVRHEDDVQSPAGPIIVETTLTPIFDADGGCCYLLGVAHDVTGRRDAERRLREEKTAAEAARSTAERASQAKTEFLSRMSHELRTPLNSVIGFANILLSNRGQRLDSRDISYLERIVTNGQHLLAIISDLLDISRIEAGKMPVTMAAVPLGPLVRTTAAGFEAQLAGRPVTLHLDLPPTIARIQTDATKLQQVLINLVGNAMKFTDGGTITIRVVTDATTARPLRVEVEDTGIGIPAHRQAAIFAAFEQAETGTTRAYGGTGLGLAISRSLCHLLGFDLGVRSTDGQGATFIVDLAPLAPAADAELG
ncbi:MAG: ATP-binding protein [Gemmatimonadaceae bacterium]